MRGQTNDCSARSFGKPLDEPESAIILGTWMCGETEGHRVLDEGAAELLTGYPELAGTELPLDIVTQRIVPTDRAAFSATVKRAEREGGPIVVEYRVRTPDGQRWLLSHGRAYAAAPGVPARGHGVLIDITDRKLRDKLDRGRLEDEADSHLENAARHTLAARHAIDVEGNALLRLLVDMLLMELGRALARRIGRASTKGLN